MFVGKRVAENQNLYHSRGWVVNFEVQVVIVRVAIAVASLPKEIPLMKVARLMHINK